MSGYRSSNGYVGFAIQAAQGTGINPSTFLRLAAEETFEQVQDVVEVRSLNGDRELDAIYKTQHTPQGSFQTYARPNLGAELLAYALGADTVVSGTGDTYVHTITKANTIPYLTFERKLDSVERFIGAKINQIVISGTSGQPITLDVSFMASDAAIQTASATATYETNEPFMFYDGTYTLDSGAITTISAFTITINNNLETIFTTSYKPNNFMEGAFDIEVAMTLKFEASETMYAAVLYGAGTALTDALDTGNFTVNLDYGTGATERKLQFAIPNLTHRSITKHLDPNTKAVYLNMISKPTKSASEIITVTAINTSGGDYISPSASSSPSSSASPSSSTSPSPSPSGSPSPSVSPSSSVSPST